MSPASPHPALRGGLLALLSAALFGLSTPLVQNMGQGLGPFTTAGLLYAGAAGVALAWGLQHTSGASASLMLTLEAVFTALLAWRWYGETLDKRWAWR